MDYLSRRSFISALLATGFMTACGSDEDDLGVGPNDGGSSIGTSGVPAMAELLPVAHSYERLATASTVDTSLVVDADRDLAARLLRLLGTAEQGNFIFSPYSIATAFSMAEAGAETETERQMRDVLGIDLPDDEWHPKRNALDASILAADRSPDGATPLELEIANAPFGQAGFAFVDDFVRTLAEHYGAELIAVDFARDPDGAGALINGWVAEQTRNRITDLLPPGSLDEMVRLVLVNTVFFKAQWVTPFSPAQTAGNPFTLSDGSSVEVEMMSGPVRTTYGEGDGWQSVRLPYWGGYSMLLFLPAAGRFDDLAAQLSDGLLEEVSGLRNDFQVQISLPRFGFETPTDLRPLFRSLGMELPFAPPPNSDFSGLSTEVDLFISTALHQATIEVDEFGTTATAATALGFQATSAPPPAEFRAERPFFFVIEHDRTSEPLFMGRVVDPRA